MPKPYPKEFREEFVRVALNRPDGVRIKGIAADFGITERVWGTGWPRLATTARTRHRAARWPSCGRRSAGSGSSSRRTRCCDERLPIWVRPASQEEG